MKRARIDPGELRTQFSLQQATPIADGAGGHTLQWAEVAAVFGRLRPIGARSRFGAGQPVETVTHEVTMRHRDDVGSGMRLTAGARVFAIVTVHDPDETGRYLVCQTLEEGR